MADRLQSSTQKLAEARRRGEPDALAEALARHANELIAHMRVVQARSELEEAAAIHRERGRSEEQARCTQLVASLHRLAGQFDEARRCAEEALALVAGTGPVAVAAHAELGEIALAQGDAATSAAAFGAALDESSRAGMGPAPRAGLLRKHAIALVNDGQHAAAITALKNAHDILAELGDHTAALRTLIEQATALHYAGEQQACSALIARVIEQARLAQDHAALADIHLLIAAQAFERNDPAAAREASHEARAAALQGVVPAAYFGAAVSLSRAANAMGDRLEAYRALATAWASLADVIGKEAAQSWVAPVLEALKAEWGEEAFQAVRAEHDALREAQRDALRGTAV